MRESKWITVGRHALLLLFVAIALYPALNVLSISLRPGNRLRSTDLAIIPDDWTLESYGSYSPSSRSCDGWAIRSWLPRASRSLAWRWRRLADMRSAGFGSSAAMRRCLRS